MALHLASEHGATYPIDLNSCRFTAYLMSYGHSNDKSFQLVMEFSIETHQLQHTAE